MRTQSIVSIRYLNPFKKLSHFSDSSLGMCERILDPGQKKHGKETPDYVAGLSTSRFN
jgi:hypothetical protein